MERCKIKSFDSLFVLEDEPIGDTRLRFSCTVSVMGCNLMCDFSLGGRDGATGLSIPVFSVTKLLFVIDTRVFSWLLPSPPSSLVCLLLVAMFR